MFIVLGSYLDPCLSGHPVPPPPSHSSFLSFLPRVIVRAPVVTGLLVRSGAGNFLIVGRPIPCIAGMLPGTAGGPARCEGVCNTRQTLRPSDTIHTSSADPLMRTDSVIDEQKEDEGPG